MNRSRATDLAIGALGMLLLFVLALVVLWWAVSTPAADSVDRTGPTRPDRPTNPSCGPELGFELHFFGTSKRTMF